MEDNREPGKRPDAHARETLLEGRRILSVDDDEFVLKIIAKVLAKVGATVFTASTVSDAYAKYNEQNGAFDIILSDISLPDGNGLDLIKNIKARGYKGATLLASGYVFDLDINGTPEEERISFIGKPFNQQELIQKIVSLVKK